jgi:CHAT domain-containing protein
VASFAALRTAGARADRAPAFLGVGDPLIGAQADGAMPYACGTGESVLAALAPPVDLSRGGGTAAALRRLSALPDTRCELAEIAAGFGAAGTVLLHDAARESALKEMSESGALAGYSVIGFATHGLIAGEVGANDAGLVLTPPSGADGREDGLLTTAEIAGLRLDAEFVLLSACNTASGRAGDDEGLSGLASAFFHAGARSLLVSHWPVYSDAAVRLTTRLFAELQADPGISRAEAARRAMLAQLDDPMADARQRHPAYWAPFMLAGTGG